MRAGREHAKRPRPETPLRAAPSADALRAAGNRALARVFAHGPRQRPIPAVQVAEIAKALGADGAFDASEWAKAQASKERVDLQAWLDDQELEYRAIDLIKDAREALAKTVKQPERPELTYAEFFEPLAADEHYDTPRRFEDEDLAVFSDDEPAPPAPRADKKRRAWDPAAFSRAFFDHLVALRAAHLEAVEEEKGEVESQLAATQPGERRLMDLAWALEKLGPDRTCVAVALSESKLHLFANKSDAALPDDVEAIELAAEEVETLGELDPQSAIESAAYEKVMDRIMSATKPRLATGKVEAQAPFERRAHAAARRTFKAGKMLRILRETLDLEVEPHVPKQAAKHAEMRLIDSIRNEGAEGAVAISKVCCAKCFAGIVAAREAGIATLHVQGAHFEMYDTANAWPVPHFLIESDEAMEAFLGKEGFAWYRAHPNEVLAAIVPAKFFHMRTAESDPYSSDDERTIKERGRTKQRAPSKRPPPSMTEPAKKKAKLAVDAPKRAPAHKKKATASKPKATGGRGRKRKASTDAPRRGPVHKGKKAKTAV